MCICIYICIYMSIYIYRKQSETPELYNFTFSLSAIAKCSVSAAFGCVLFSFFSFCKWFN